MATFSCVYFTQAQVSTGSKIEFTYDVSGNQEQRGVPGGSNPKKPLAKDSTQVDPHTELEVYTKAIENKFVVSPNPTNGEVVLQWEPDMATKILNIELVSLMSSATTDISRNQSNSVQIDLSREIPGLYLVIFYLKDEKVASVQKKIIKM